jgi:hypothetical protein
MTNDQEANEHRERSVLPIGIAVALLMGVALDNWVAGVFIGAAFAALLNALRKRQESRRGR